MADYERTLLTHYNLQTLQPYEWPAEKDDGSDSSDLDADDKKKYNAHSVTTEAHTGAAPFSPTKELSSGGFEKGHLSRRSKSRYSALERGIRSRTSVPGSQKIGDGVENLVQQDEPDPLGLVGSSAGGRGERERGSVVQVLRQKGVPVDEDVRLSQYDDNFSFYLLRACSFHSLEFLLYKTVRSRMMKQITICRTIR